MAALESNADRVVLAPDVIGCGFSEAHCGAILNLWRDGRLRPIVNRALLLRYLKLLRGLGLSELMIRRWGWWFSSNAKVLFLPESTPPGWNGAALCAGLARAGEARWILCRSRPSSLPAPEPGQEEPVPWMTVDEHLKTLASNRE